jgi:Beige/BEACH domain
VAAAWRGCLEGTSDVKELVPEFFYDPEFLRNADGHRLGTRQVMSGLWPEVVRRRIVSGLMTPMNCGRKAARLLAELAAIQHHNLFLAVAKWQGLLALLFLPTWRPL